MYVLTSCVCVVVNTLQGSLDPYEKKMLKIIFAPQFEKSCLGWTHHQSMPIHKDFALFVQFLHIGASNANVSQGEACMLFHWSAMTMIFDFKVPLQRLQ